MKNSRQDFKNNFFENWLLLSIFCCLCERGSTEICENFFWSEARFALKFGFTQVRVLHDWKNGGLVSTEKPCTFWPLKNEKTLENPGFFGQVSFLLCQYGRVEQKRYQPINAVHCVFWAVPVHINADHLFCEPPAVDIMQIQLPHY